MLLIDLININFDLLNVGIAIAGIAVLGFAVYFNNSKSVTNKSFLFFAIATIFWGISNYLEYKFTTVTGALWALRIHLFISVWHAFSFFLLSYTFPYEKKEFPYWFKFILIPLIIAISLFTLTPFVFSRVIELAPAGEVTNPERGFGLPIFAFLAFGLLFWGIILLIKKVLTAKGIERTQTIFILVGMFLTACLILLFNVLLPVTFNDLTYIPFAALFVFPFIGLSSYTIYKHRLFNVKLIAVTFVAFLLTVFSFVNVINSTSWSSIILNATAFVVVLIGSLQLIRALLSLEIANENQANLMHFMNHQIKGRFGNAKNVFAELLTNDYGVMPDNARPLLEKGLAEANLGVEYVQGILKGASAESGTLPYEMKPMDFKPVVEGVFEKQKKNGEKKGLHLNLTIKEGDYHITGDSVQLGEAVRNLIGNSTNYTPEGSIDVTLSRINNAIQFKIKDTGVGISEEDKPRMFKSGGRGAESLKINVNATGYGLAFVKGVIEAHKGQVWVESDGRGKGSTFFFTLPTS